MTRTHADLARALGRIDGRGYPAYKVLRGGWRLPDFRLDFRRVQGDPFAAPSSLAVTLDAGAAQFDPALLETPPRRTGLACFLARAFARRARAASRSMGSGRSGELRMVDPGQVVLPITAVAVAADGTVEARFTAGLPAAGRRVLGRKAESLLLGVLPALVRETLVAGAHPADELRRQAEVNEDADHLRGQLEALGLVAFIANGALLPRRSGIDDRPLAADRATLFRSPPGLEVELDRPNAGPVRGMGVGPGVTLLVGGGYHGKSTVLEAVARGVYNHRPGDGRECVVTDPTATRIQAEDGRSVAGVDISPFIDGLPGGQDTTRFSTANASGSTSQAAAIIEAVEAGSRLILIDEDTAATNFMIRDRRMQALLRDEDEPITPLIDRVRSLHADAGASTLLVIGGSGDYLDVADRVVGMIRYLPRDLTDGARRVAGEHPTGRIARGGMTGWPSRHRCPDPGSIRTGRGRRPVSVRARGPGAVEVGTERIDLGGVRQIASRAQARAVGLAVVAARRFMGPGRAVEDVMEALAGAFEREGLDMLDAARAGDLAMPRMQEVAAALSRLRTLEVGGCDRQVRG